MKRISLRAHQSRMIAHAIRKGKFTEEMGENRRAMVKWMRSFSPIFFVSLLFYLLISMSLNNAWADGPLGWVLFTGINVELLTIGGIMLVKIVHFAKIERRLRRAAILDGRLRPRFPDRIWAWRQGRVIAG